MRGYMRALIVSNSYRVSGQSSEMTNYLKKYLILFIGKTFQIKRLEFTKILANNIYLILR